MNAGVSVMYSCIYFSGVRSVLHIRLRFCNKSLTSMHNLFCLFFTLNSEITRCFTIRGRLLRHTCGWRGETQTTQTVSFERRKFYAFYKFKKKWKSIFHMIRRRRGEGNNFERLSSCVIPRTICTSTYQHILMKQPLSKQKYHHYELCGRRDMHQAPVLPVQAQRHPSLHPELAAMPMPRLMIVYHFP